MRITVESLSWAVGGRTVVREVDFEVAPGETVGLIGPNGCGKSSLLRCVAALRAPSAGTVRYDGLPVAGWSPRRTALALAFVEQSPATDAGMRVADVVGLGRTPYQGRWRGPGPADREAVARALVRTGLVPLAGRTWRELSGGERQRAHLARALAQETGALVLDEPTNHLDVRHQLELLELVSGSGRTVLVALHDLALAARYCDRLLLMHHGRLVASGTPAEVLAPARLAEVFEVDAEPHKDPLGHLALAYRGPLPRHKNVDEGES
ncbi:ABC transporter ATP-binding protein [Streptomyces sp. NPDC051567]|uniref:ABC transporter ATP-binding protein n=1 Tax=Streptomyces sp. NPDC051567 TaxID=3365660 RepID=UPI0037B53C92